MTLHDRWLHQDEIDACCICSFCMGLRRKQDSPTTTMTDIKDFKLNLIAQEMKELLGQPAVQDDQPDRLMSPAPWCVTVSFPDSDRCTMAMVHIDEELSVPELSGEFAALATDRGGDCGHATNLLTQEVIYFGSDVERISAYIKGHQRLKKQPPRGFGK